MSFPVNQIPALAKQHCKSKTPSEINQAPLSIQFATMLGHAAAILFDLHCLQTTAEPLVKTKQQMLCGKRINRRLNLMEAWLSETLAAKALRGNTCAETSIGARRSTSNLCANVLNRILLKDVTSTFSVAHSTIRFVDYIRLLLEVMNFYAFANQEAAAATVDFASFLHVYRGIVKLADANMDHYTQSLKAMLEAMD